MWRHGGMGKLYCSEHPGKAEGVQRRGCGVRHVFPGSPSYSGSKSLCEHSPVKIGCQGVYRDDTAENGNFGAFTTNRTANAAKAMGCSSVIIGHCEERRDKAGILEEAGVTDEDAIGRLLNQEIKAAIQAGLTVLYCIGETAGEQEHWQEVLKSQLETGLKDVDKEKVVIAYEPYGPSDQARRRRMKHISRRLVPILRR